MRAPLPRALFAITLLGLAFGAVSVAFAYVPSAEFVLKLMAEKRRDLKLRDLSAQLLADVEGVEGQVDEHLYIKSPERVRLVAQRDDGNVVFVSREGQAYAGPENALEKLKSNPDLTGLLLVPMGTELEGMAARILSTLKAAGVDTSVVSLGHQEDTLAYIIGARSSEPEKPQVWIYKATLQPMRTVLYDRSKSPASRVETRYLDYGSPIGGDYLPGTIEVWRDGKRVRRSELTKLSVNQGLPETLFELPRR